MHWNINLETSVGTVPQILMRRMITSVWSEMSLRTKYPEELRKFAVITLQFYLCKEYDYVHKT